MVALRLIDVSQRKLVHRFVELVAKNQDAFEASPLDMNQPSPLAHLMVRLILLQVLRAAWQIQ